MARSGVVSPENQSTIVVVAMILSMIALAFTFYTFERLNTVAGALANSSKQVDQRAVDGLAEANERIAELEAEVEALKQAAATAD